ncbi:DUF885 domain-containing protein [Dokdonella sp.]|uniref:DUF885 domain-containing protein n=1 Tax=Dokdonella sp. TaxID=2291710 RepID=UPI003C465E33
MACIRTVLSITLLGVLLAACQPNSTPAPKTEPEPARETQAPDPGIAWQAAVDTFINGFFERNPVFAASSGKHEFDGRLPDYSPQALADNASWLHAQHDAVAAFKDEQLDKQQRFERDYVLSMIDSQLFTLEDSGFPYSNPMYYAGDLSPSMYLTRPYAPLAQRMTAFVSYLEALPLAIDQIRTNMRPPLPATYVELGINTFGGYSRFFAEDVPAIFSEVDDADLQARFKIANENAIKATGEMSDWFTSLKPEATQDFALGAEKFSRMLRMNERVDLPLDQIKAAGEADLSRNLASLKSACHEYAPGETLKRCVDKAASNKPEGGAVEGAREQLAGLRSFLVEKDLVTIPGTEEAKVEEAPPFNRWNFAYIEIPGPYETNLPSVYYIAPPNPDWPKAEREAYVPGKAALLFVSAHEVWPGHFLQFLHANRSKWIFGRLFVGYAYAEGWAHYTEEMMFDAGLDGATPETHIGQLTNALLRNVRYLSAVGLHTGGMSLQESEQMFLDQAYQDPGNARQQAARGTYDPGYLNYTLGKLMIMQLREDWTATRGGRESWKAFHDEFLSYGGPPIPLVRAQMLDGEIKTSLWQAPALGPPAN